MCISCFFSMSFPFLLSLRNKAVSAAPHSSPVSSNSFKFATPFSCASLSSVPSSPAKCFSHTALVEFSCFQSVPFLTFRSKPIIAFFASAQFSTAHLYCLLFVLDNITCPGVLRGPTCVLVSNAPCASTSAFRMNSFMWSPSASVRCPSCESMSSHSPISFNSSVSTFSPYASSLSFVLCALIGVLRVLVFIV